jgi:putative restriction endonuclease
MEKKRKGEWSDEELILAFNLYCKTPFGKIHIRNPKIIKLSKIIGRTPSSVSWKLANFAHLDPSLKKGILLVPIMAVKLEKNGINLSTIWKN